MSCFLTPAVRLLPAPLTPQQLAFFAILVAALALLITERLPTDAVAMLTILGLVFTGVLPTEDALAGFRSEPALVIAAIFVLSAGFQTTGLADMFGRWGLQGSLASLSETPILLGLFAFVGVVVQFMGSDSATTALFGPVAISLAQALNQAPEAYVLTVAMAAVTAVFTPMSHHNLIIYGPGGYRFFDYFRVGAPLTVVVVLVVAFLAPVVWPA
jgi:di/tricarboxylate transporter